MITDHKTRAHILKYHKDNIHSFGVDSDEALGWKKRENQRKRFEALCSIGDLEWRNVLDAGCGRADLLAFLDENSIQCRYTGMDHVEEFIEYAAHRFRKHQKCRFLVGDFWSNDTGIYDFILASGALGYYNPDPLFIYKIIWRLFSRSEFGFAFNLAEKVEGGGGLVAYNKHAVVAYCEKLCRKVVLKDDYLEGDFTVMMYR